MAGCDRVNASQLSSGPSKSVAVTDNPPADENQYSQPEFDTLSWSDSCSEIPIATHFSPIHFSEWHVDSDDSESQFQWPKKFHRDGSESHELPPDIEPGKYHNVKFGEPWFYETDSCYFPENCPKMERSKRTFQYDICDMSAIRNDGWILKGKFHSLARLWNQGTNDLAAGNACSQPDLNDVDPKPYGQG